MSPNGQTGASLDSELNGTVESSDGYDELKCRAPRLIVGLGSMVVACSMLTSLSRQRFLARSRLSAQPHALLTPTHTYNTTLDVPFPLLERLQYKPFLARTVTAGSCCMSLSLHVPEIARIISQRHLTRTVGPIALSWLAKSGSSAA